MLSRGFIVLWIATLVAVMGIGMVSPLLPVYVRDELGGPEVAVALSFSALALTQLLAAPFVGRFGDRYGFKRFIVGGFMVYGLGALGYLFADSWQLVVAFRALSGFGAAGIFPMSMAYIGLMAPHGREGEYSGMYAISWVAGFGIGPLAGGGLRDLVSSNAAFAAMALMLFLVGFMTFLLLPARPRRPDGLEGTGPAEEEEAAPWGVMIRRPVVQAALWVRTVLSIGWGAGFTYVAVYVISEDGLNTGSATFVGLLLAARSLTGAVVQPFTGRLADRYSRTLLVGAGLSVVALLQFMVPMVPDRLVDVELFGGTLVIVPWLLVVFIALGIAEAVELPAQQAIFVDVGRHVGMGSIMGLSEMSGSIGFLGGSLLGALVVSVWGLEAVFRYAGLMILFGAIVFLVLMWRAREELRELKALDAASLPAVVGSAE